MEKFMTKVTKKVKTEDTKSTAKKLSKTEGHLDAPVNHLNPEHDPANINVKGLDVNPAPASQSINGEPVSNQYANTFGGDADPGAVVPANNPTKDNVKDLQVAESDVDHSKDKHLSYKDTVEARGLVEGDMVRVKRAPLPAEAALWGGIWPHELQHTIGRKYVLGANNGATGYTIDIGNGVTYLFPVYSLEKVVG
jgi:hypothetical protein